MLKNEIGFSSFLWICVLSTALASMTGFKSKNLGLAVGLTLCSLFVVSLLAQAIDNYLNKQAAAEDYKNTFQRINGR